MENNYLIPANSKRGNLIFNWFRPIDLMIFGSGVGSTILLLMIFSSADTLTMFATLLPAMVAAALVMPVPNQHNILVLLGAVIKYYTNQQRYRWKGWNIYESFK